MNGQNRTSLFDKL